MRRIRVILCLGLAALFTPANFAGCSALSLLGGCSSRGAGWTFNMQTAGFTISYENRLNKDGENEFTQTFDPEGMNILTGAIRSLKDEPESE